MKDDFYSTKIFGNLEKAGRLWRHFQGKLSVNPRVVEFSKCEPNENQMERKFHVRNFRYTWRGCSFSPEMLLLAFTTGKRFRNSNRNFWSNGKRQKRTDLLIFLYFRSVWVPSISKGVWSGAILVSVPEGSLFWMRKQRLDFKIWHEYCSNIAPVLSNVGQYLQFVG